jgi:hypothetical protein
MDSNYWGLICVPIGIFICFSPALLWAAFGKIEETAAEKVESKKH